MVRIYDEAIQPFETAHSRTVRELGPQCTVLLKKDGSFPLRSPGRIAAFGEGVCHTLIGGTGSGDVNVRGFVSVEEGLRQAGFTISHEADTAIYVLSRSSGEGNDRQAGPGDIALTEEEVQDILSASKAFPRFMLVLNVCGLVDLTPVKEVGNILLLSQLGIPTGHILADLLLGKAYPSGKLAMTWAPLSAYPSTEGFGDMDDTVYQEGIYVGYRYFRSFRAPCTWPFGYGLGYSEFQVEPREVTAEEGQVTAEVQVANIGDYPGRETVQLYVAAPRGRLDKPALELRGFAKTRELAPGEKEVLQITFHAKDMASYAEADSAFVLEQGDYVILLGTDCERVAPAAVLRLDEATVVQRVKPICPADPHLEIRPDAPISWDTGELPVIRLLAADLPCKESAYSGAPRELPKEEVVLWQEVVRGEKSLEQFVGSLSVEQMIHLSIGDYREGAEGTVIGVMSKSLEGAAGETTGQLSALGVPTLTMADGPAGLRLSPRFRETDDRLRYQFCTAIPIATALAQSWNPEVCRTCGELVGEEMEIYGADLWLAPAQNIQRSPLCGRDFEYMSEDPYLSGICAGHLVLGAQSHPGCGATIKHFACNNQETNRFRSNSIVSERALREIYLKTFQVSMEICEPFAVMTSYNLVNGEHTCNSRDLITCVLREEWGFGGLVMTDWCVTTGDQGAARRENRHPVASAAGCVKAGNDITMPGAWSDEEDMRRALADGEHGYPLSVADLQKAAMHVLQTILRTGGKQ